MLNAVEIINVWQWCGKLLETVVKEGFLDDRHLSCNMKTARLTITERNIKHLGSSGKNREVLRQNKYFMKMREQAREGMGRLVGTRTSCKSK